MQYCWLVLKVMQDFIPGGSILAGFNRNFVETWLLVKLFSSEHGMLYFQMCWFVYSWMYQASWMRSSKLWRWIWAEKRISNKNIYKPPIFLGFQFLLFFFSGGVGGCSLPGILSRCPSWKRGWFKIGGTGGVLGSVGRNCRTWVASLHASHRMDTGTSNNPALRPRNI